MRCRQSTHSCARKTKRPRPPSRRAACPHAGLTPRHDARNTTPRARRNLTDSSRALACRSRRREAELYRLFAGEYCHRLSWIRDRVSHCRVLAELRHAPSLALIPLSYGFDNRRPSQRALASDARGRRSGRRPCVCLVLSSSAGARCAVVSSNATLFPLLEHSAGRTWHRREHAPVCRLSALLRHAEPSGGRSLLVATRVLRARGRRWI